MPVVCGIDPGLKGAIAFVDSRDMSLRAAHPLPVKQVGTKARVDIHALTTWLDGGAPFPMPAEWHFGWVAGKPRLSAGGVIIERQGVKPGEGNVSGLTIGLNYGLLLGMLETLGIPYFEVQPAQWKRGLSVGPEKAHSISRAQAFWPRAVSKWTGPRGGVKDGVCEAALIARYGAMRGLFGGPSDRQDEAAIA